MQGYSITLNMLLKFNIKHAIMLKYNSIHNFGNICSFKPYLSIYNFSTKWDYPSHLTTNFLCWFTWNILSAETLF